MVKKIYTVVFQSTIGSGTVNTSETFFYDWSNIDEGQYAVTFAFMSANGAQGLSAQNPVNLYVDLGQGAYTQVASSLTTQAGSGVPGTVYSPSYLGTLEWGYMGLAASYTFYFARPNTNTPIYLEQRPRNNAVNIQFFTNAANQVTVPTVIPGAYTLTLSLQQL